LGLLQWGTCGEWCEGGTCALDPVLRHAPALNATGTYLLPACTWPRAISVATWEVPRNASHAGHGHQRGRTLAAWRAWCVTLDLKGSQTSCCQVQVEGGITWRKAAFLHQTAARVASAPPAPWPQQVILHHGAKHQHQSHSLEPKQPGAMFELSASWQSCWLGGTCSLQPVCHGSAGAASERHCRSCPQTPRRLTVSNTRRLSFIGWLRLKTRAATQSAQETLLHIRSCCLPAVNPVRSKRPGRPRTW
jgi:hypothetical protein